ncbi:hypothetical protein PUNSTDRAFT_48385 [Punctularia strigosozonata HHB-11173 SS5]|uniref:uncharacterized protein n=1 Tax=Punctularia strigosozonata (strain HHB-11173) TaxID=741275 RepID=UPI0004416D80|nr:uncharacterized protein PUNSTDRAFT_48385 [Punctularia strigosozonata HHB-11173 SS5]EIN13402.1 hypothetical protein PUNSTDRAFT_48385 [Punctularia strigosozonata HHB-11173 SS5]
MTAFGKSEVYTLTALRQHYQVAFDAHPLLFPLTTYTDHGDRSEAPLQTSVRTICIRASPVLIRHRGENHPARVIVRFVVCSLAVVIGV